MTVPIDLPALRGEGARILCIGAHADDLEIGAGGTIARLVGEFPGLSVSWLVLSATTERANEAEASARALVCTARGEVDWRPDDSFETGSLPDGRLPAHWSSVKDAIEAVRPTQPMLVMAPWLHDRHQDHRVVAEIVWQVFRDHLIWCYEIPKYEGDLGHPNLHVPLTDEQASAKVDHLRAHFASQHHRQWYDEEAFRAHLRLRGIGANARWAEAFHVPKLVW